MVVNCVQGQLFINGFNVGRYWPTAGPQVTLYIPAGILRAAPSQNNIVMLELEKCPACTEPSATGKNSGNVPINDKIRAGLKFENGGPSVVKMWNSANMYELDIRDLKSNVIDFVDKPIISGQCFTN